MLSSTLTCTTRPSTGTQLYEAARTKAAKQSEFRTSEPTFSTASENPKVLCRGLTLAPMEVQLLCPPIYPQVGQAFYRSEAILPNCWEKSRDLLRRPLSRSKRCSILRRGKKCRGRFRLLDQTHLADWSVRTRKGILMKTRNSSCCRRLNCLRMLR